MASYYGTVILPARVRKPKDYLQNPAAFFSYHQRDQPGLKIISQLVPDMHCKAVLVHIVLIKFAELGIHVRRLA